MADKKTNLMYFDVLGTTPSEARKKITGGSLNGMTDINPMWRIKAMTSLFGPQGEGWYFDNISYWTTEACGEIVAWCSLELYVRLEDGSWSKPICGVGGNKICGKGKGAGVVNDEAYKMAFTDAQSIAFKGLGMSSDIYFANDKTKYTEYTSPDNGSATQDDTPQYCTDAEVAKADFAKVTNIKDFAELFNGKYGGNRNVTPEIKKIANARLNELPASGKPLNSKAV